MQGRKYMIDIKFRNIVKNRSCEENTSIKLKIMRAK